MKSKRIIGAMLVCCLLITLFSGSAWGAAETAWEKDEAVATVLLEAEEVSLQNRPLQGRIREIFPDPNLAEVIANAFGVPVNAVVLGTDLARILAFNAEGRGIRSLEGMEHLSALQEVNLNRNQISDLTPLSDLRYLERLLLDDNQVGDLSPAAGLTRLRHLWLDRNRVERIEPLENLRNLEWLTLWVNEVEDISSLSGLTQLSALWLGDNNIRDIHALEQLTNLETLMLVRNQISDLRPLQGMEGMQTLWIGRQDINLPGLMRENPFEMENILRTPCGLSIEPETISENGSYHSPKLRWTGMTAAVYEVSYAFDQEIYVGYTSDRFYGTVTQALAATPFRDVQRGDWFYDAVAFVFEQNLMGGLSDLSFAPAQEASRGMIVTILWRVAGEPVASIPSEFQDVPEGAWFEAAANWAREQGIIQGYGSPEIFAPTVTVTREQFALMLYRFALRDGEGDIIPDDFTLERYADHAEISNWAEEAMSWAVYHGLITSTRQNMLNPSGLTIRAESAMILMRYLEL